jgi:hypothetical protein
LKFKPREKSLLSLEYKETIEKVNMRKQLQDKAISYAKNIKIIYPPKIDEQKRAELEQYKS